MLRASSLGLSFPVPIIFPVQSCRLLKRSRVTLVFSRTGSTARNPPVSASDQGTEGKSPHAVDSETPLSVGHTSACPRLYTRLEPVEYLAKFMDVKAIPVTSGRQPQPPAPDSEEPTLQKRHSLEIVAKDAAGGLDTRKSRVITQPPAYHAGRPWSPLPIKFAEFPPSLKRVYQRFLEEAQEVVPPSTQEGDDSSNPCTDAQAELSPIRQLPVLFKAHIQTISKTECPEEGWNSYVYLVDLIAEHEIVHKYFPYIPFAHLHRLARIIARNRPKTQQQYLRLLSVLTYLQCCGGIIQQHEWNALIDHSVAGLRRIRPEDVSGALAVLKGMRTGQLPGLENITSAGEDMLQGAPMHPDVHTFTTLITIAARAGDSDTLRNLTALMDESGVLPNRITHLAMVKYFVLKKNLDGVRETLRKMKEQKLDLGLDGLNACILAYALSGRLDVVMMIYRMLRHNVFPEEAKGLGNISSTIDQLKEEFIVVDLDIWPNEITYTSVVQALAHHGHFTAAVTVFRDMLSIHNLEQGAVLLPTDLGELRPTRYQPTVAIYRAIFLGFSKHVVQARVRGALDGQRRTRRGLRERHELGRLESDWNLENLLHFIDLFLSLDSNARPTHTTFYAIMNACNKASGHNIQLLRRVWTLLDQRFTISLKEGSQNRLARLRNHLFPEKDQSTTTPEEPSSPSG